MSDDEAPAYFQISRENHSPWVVVTSITCLVYSLMAVTAKIVSRLQLSAMKAFDLSIVASTAFAFAQTACMVAASKNGLGRHQATLTSTTVASFSKYTYAASILFIVSMFFAKLSVILFLMAITPSKPIHRCCHVLSAIIAGWTVCGVFALAFQCQLPSPWMTVDNQCIDRFGLQLFLGIVNIVTDLGLIVIPTIVMKNVQTNTRRKWQVVALFATRIFVPAFTIPQLVAYRKFYDSSDETWAIVLPAIWSQLMMNLSILTACVPSLKGVLDMFRSGTSLFTVPAQYESALGSNSNPRLGTRMAQTFGMRSISKRSGNRSAPDTKMSAAEWPTLQMKKVTGQSSAEVSGSKRDLGNSKRILERSESQRSLTENVIMRTVNFEVGFEEMKPQNTAGTDQHSRSSTDAEVTTLVRDL